MKMVYIQDGKQLETYMHPKRQHILRELGVQGPMTAKMLSDTLEMIPPQCKTSCFPIDGITGSRGGPHSIDPWYYRKRLVMVSFCSLAEEKRKLVSDMVTRQIHEKRNNRLPMEMVISRRTRFRESYISAEMRLMSFTGESERS
jgi:hypothetical protein